MINTYDIPNQSAGGKVGGTNSSQVLLNGVTDVMFS